MKPKHSTFRHVSDLWNDAEAARLEGVARLVYRSNKLGTDLRITNTCGGNTSSKIMEKDPLTAERISVLWVKGSGGDLRTSMRENFSSLYQRKLLELQKTYARRRDKGLKSRAEDDMAGMYAHTTFNLNPRAPSIDTPLHSFLPAKHVDHLHPNAIIAIAASSRCEQLTQEIFGGEMAYVKWMRPGFELGLAMQDLGKKHKRARAIMLGQHGFISWADDDQTCYRRTLGFIEKAARFIEAKYEAKGGDATAFGGAKHEALPPGRRAEVFAAILPWLRGQVSRQKRRIATVQDDDKILRFVNSRDAQRLAALGTSCPDHFLRTKIQPLLADWDPATGDVAALQERLAAGLARYRKQYAAYYQKCRRPDSPAMRDANPTVILIPGCGMIGWGRDKSESRMTAEFFNCAVEVMRGAEAIDRYVALPEQEAFDIEYWPLEEAKLKRMPPEKELARQVVIVIGAGSGSGRELAQRIAPEGAQVVCVDADIAAAKVTAKAITDRLGAGIGVAGSGISNCGPAIGLAANIEDRASVRAMLDEAVLAYGGIDSVVITTGMFVPPAATGRIQDDQKATTIAANVSGTRIVGEEAFKTWQEQGLTGNLVLTTSANTVASRLVQFEPDRALTRGAITSADVIEAIYLLLTRRLSKTAGQGIAEDDALREAFLR